MSWLEQVPAITLPIGVGYSIERRWAKCAIDLKHPLAWRVVQELGHV